jgi:Right handed beta helix region
VGAMAGRQHRINHRRAAGLLAALTAGVFAATAGAHAQSTSCPGAISGSGSGTVYYVSPTGSDAAAGTSPCSAWQTLGRVESAGLQPGDTVAFQGGATWTSPLAPYSNESGSPSEPITFTSYGSGQASLAAGVYLQSVHDIALAGLTLSNPSGPGVFSSSSGTGASDITIAGSTISGTASYGVASNQAADADWTIRSSTISHTGDSGIYCRCSGLTATGDTISATGTSSAITWAKHGIYAKGPGATIVANTISDSQTSGVSLRQPGDTVQDNTISGGQKGIDFNSEASSGATTYLLGNTISGPSDTGISVSAGEQALHESFVIASNTVYNAGNYELYLISGSPGLRLANNLFQTTGTRSYLNMPAPLNYTSSTYGEHYDLFYGSGNSAPFSLNGSPRSFATYSSWFGPGAVGNDLVGANPRLDTTTFALGAGSPAIGAGTLTVPGITYQHVASCPISGSTTLLQWTWCGASGAPDLGSH